MAKADKKVNTAPKNVQAFERLGFLHQAAMLMSTIRYESNKSTSSPASVKNWKGDPPGTLHATSRYLNSNMRQITGKLVMRLDPSVKRTVCKRCDTPLIPVITSQTRIKSKPAPTVVNTCKICKFKRRYTTQQPNYELFSERSDVNVSQDDSMAKLP